MTARGRWRIGLWLTLVAIAARLVWTLAVPTIPVGDFATYRESAIYLAEFGHLDPGFVYMPGLVLLLAALHSLGGEVLAAKLVGVAFGGLAAGPVYGIAARLLDNGRAAVPGQDAAFGDGYAADARSLRPSRPSPIQEGLRHGDAAPLAAGLAYALWPAGIAVSSVIGTDIPTAALILLALALLCLWGPRRPLFAAAAFGAAMGLAAYFRAVALPLAVLSAGYWVARRSGVRAIVTRTAVGVLVTVLVLLPWGLRNRRQSGVFYLTDSHGGITALMGNDPNTEGTYSRALSALFRQLTGRTFLMEPHRVTDQVAYALARRWMAFDPAWTAGMIALRTERLFAPERGLLYWPVYRRGVVPAATAAWFDQHRRAITALADLFYWCLLAGVTAGVAFAAVERRWTVLVPLPFALGLAGLYALFVAEPRYRLTTEVLLFPVFGFGAARLVGSVGRLAAPWTRRLADLRDRASRARHGLDPQLRPGARTSPRSMPPPRPAPRTSLASDRAGLKATLVGALALALVAVAVARGGAALRDRHRWAATVWTVDGRPQLALWRPGPGTAGPSPVRGASPGAVLTLSAGQRTASAEIVLPDLRFSRATLAAHAALSWKGIASPGLEISFADGGAAPVGAPSWSGAFVLGGEMPVRIAVRLTRPVASRDEASVSISDVVLASVTPP